MKLGFKDHSQRLEGKRCVTEWCDKKSKPRSPPLLTWCIRASPLPLVPGQCWKDPGFCPSQPLEEGIAEPISLYSLHLEEDIAR